MGWAFHDGALVSQSKEPFPSVLFSQRSDYDHFHLRMEAMLGDGAQGWIVLRAGPPGDGRGDYQGYGVRIGETGILPGAPTGSLALTARAALPSLLSAAPPLAPKPGEWFPLEIIAEGNRVRVFINGNTAVDYMTTETFTIGRLGLVRQKGAEVRFRKMEFKELPPPASPPPLPDVRGDAKGFVSLFNGKDMTGWKVLPPKAGSIGAATAASSSGSNRTRPFLSAWRPRSWEVPRRARSVSMDRRVGRSGVSMAQIT
jgi:hypothetical protein